MADTSSLGAFSPDYRASGVLLHLASLPSPYGIGDLGPSAFAFIDRLHEAGQSWWQVLPLGPTGYGNSPYQPLSTFAGNELLFSPEGLIEDGLLPPDVCAGKSFSNTAVDYADVIPFKRQLLQIAWTAFSVGARPDLRSPFDQFCHDQRHWLEDYALFRALKARHDGAYYLEWPAKLIQRDPASITLARGELANQIDMVRFAQFLLSHQGGRVKEHARSKGVYLLGDLPFFVASDSSDVWTHPELFLLDEQQRPRVVAGVPPDYFSTEGQLWGNPVYDWDAMRQTGYRWWIDRLGAWLGHVDLVRLDHFRAFAAAWHIPAGASTARAGQWSLGPGADLFNMVQKELGALPFVAEDLGLITPDVHELRDQFNLPGTRVLQFAFDGNSGNPHLPRNYEQNTVVYTGTHDNPPTRAWFEKLTDQQKQNVSAYLGRSSLDTGEVAAALVESAWSSVAALAIAPLQDLLNLGSGAEINVPGNPEGNWRWRCTEELLAALDVQWLRDLTLRSDRHLTSDIWREGRRP